MPTWAKIALRTVGALNVALAVLGAYGMFWGMHAVLGRVPSHPADAPYVGVAFAIMTAINITFLMLFLIAAFQLLRLKRSGIVVHSVTSVSLIAYTFLIGTLWLEGQGIGRSVAAATGVGNMGVAPFEFLFVAPYVFPIASTIALLTTRRKIRSHAAGTG
jgi:uncharacterized membrane protein YozB (DUF420 family)